MHSDGTVTPLADLSPDARKQALEAVREAKGRRAICPAKTLADAVRDVEASLIVPAWSAGESAADVAAGVLRSTFGLDPAAVPLVWALYSEAARRLGFTGQVPVPILMAETGSATVSTATA